MVLTSCTLCSVTQAQALRAKTVDNCKPILTKKIQSCTEPNANGGGNTGMSAAECAQTNTIVDNVYAMCRDTEEDKLKIFRAGAFTDKHFKSSRGFAFAFKATEINTANKDIEYQKIKNEFETLKRQYQPIKSKNNEFLTYPRALIDREQLSLLNQDEVQIEESIQKLDFILSNPATFEQFRKSYRKFLPDILLDKPEYTQRFKNQTFSKAECDFLKLKFKKDALEQLQRKFNYQCSAV